MILIESEAFVAPKVKPSSSNPPDIPANQSTPPQVAAEPIPQMSATYQKSIIPTIPDQEEQEALSQLLLAWYQAGYAAGRYVSIRQRKQGSCVCS